MLDTLLAFSPRFVAFDFSFSAGQTTCAYLSIFSSDMGPGGVILTGPGSLRRFPDHIISRSSIYQAVTSPLES